MLLESPFFLFDVAGSFIISFINPAIYAIFVLGTLLPLIAVGCRRMHDVGRSGWFQERSTGNQTTVRWGVWFWEKDSPSI